MFGAFEVKTYEIFRKTGKEFYEEKECKDGTWKKVLRKEKVGFTQRIHNC